MKTVIEKITPIREGEAIIVSLSLSDGAHEEKYKHEIATDLFLDMGFPLSSGDGIEISQDGYRRRRADVRNKKRCGSHRFCTEYKEKSCFEAASQGLFKGYFRPRGGLS